MTKVNVAGLRFIADAIELNEKMYNQRDFGATPFKPELAGTGLQCDTPCCIAGFTVQLLGNMDDLVEEQVAAIPIVRNTGRLNIKEGVSRYAQKLLGLSDNWRKSLFNCPSWPACWLDKNKTPITSNRISITVQSEFLIPTAEQAAYVLRRLADQFEEEQGANENAIHTTIAHAESVEIA